MPVPAEHHAVFDALVRDAEALYGRAAVTVEVLGPESGDVPYMETRGLWMLGEQSIVLGSDDRFGATRRFEFDWDEAGEEGARAVLRMHAERMRPGPTRADVLAARVVALVGVDGDVTVSTVQAEFDRVIGVTPRRSGAVPFEVLLVDGEVAYVTGPHIGWWTFGGAGIDDGIERAWWIVERLVLDGGAIRTTWRASELLAADGTAVAGPNRVGPRSLRPRRLHFASYR